MSSLPPSLALKSKLADGRQVLGTWNLLKDPDLVEIMCKAGLDFVIHDLEHGTHSLQHVSSMVRAAHTHNSCLLVRPPGLDIGMIQRVLDAGCDGLMVPNIQSVAEAQSVVRATLYPPEGERGLSPFTRAMGYDGQDVSERMEGQNKAVIVGILVEGAAGIGALDDILATCGAHLDVVYVGVYDLAKQVGSTDNVMSPVMLEQIQNVVDKVSAAGAAAGLLINSPEMTEFARLAGANFIAYKNDTAIVFDAVQRLCQTVKAEGAPS